MRAARRITVADMRPPEGCLPVYLRKRWLRCPRRQIFEGARTWSNTFTSVRRSPARIISAGRRWHTANHVRRPFYKAEKSCRKEALRKGQIRPSPVVAARALAVKRFRSATTPQCPFHGVSGRFQTATCALECCGCECHRKRLRHRCCGGVAVQISSPGR